MNIEKIYAEQSIAHSVSYKKYDELLDKAELDEESSSGVFYQATFSSNAVESVPCETYNQMVKNVKSCEVPYEYMVDENGTITYNGTVFQCDRENHALCLGDMEETDNILTIPLTEGGVLKVNRRNVGELGRAIGLFSPQDIKRILQALAIDAKVHSKKCEVENEENETYNKICRGEEDS